MFSKEKSVVLLFVAVVAFAGCDLLSPKPAPVKKVAAVKAAPAVAADPATKPSDVKEEALPDGILAKVGDWTISMDEFNRRIDAVKKMVKDFDDKNVETKKMILDELIRQQLLVQEARSQKVDRQKEIVEAVQDFENTLLVQDLVGGLTKDVKAVEQDAKDYYDANPDLFIRPVEKQLREIVVPSEAEAKDILVKALQGTDFVQMVKESSKGKSAEKGGDLGFVEKAPFEQMQKAVEGLNKGGVSAVFQGPEGYYVVKVEDVRGGDKAAFADIKEDLIKGLTVQKQQQAVMDKLNDVAKRVNVKVNPSLLEKTGE